MHSIKDKNKEKEKKKKIFPDISKYTKASLSKVLEKIEKNENYPL